MRRSAGDFEQTVVPDLRAGKTVLIVAHGNSLRALVKYLDGISDEEIVGLNIPTGIPLRYDLDGDLKPIVAGGTYDDSEGFFIRPTVVEHSDPTAEYFVDEYFGPLLGVHVYEDDAYDAMLTQMESVSPYALTGAIIAQDRAAIAHASDKLRFAAGNFYINDKPTGAVVGQQPFGGGRASGTNDKAGAPQNLLRWTSTRSIKETFVPPKDHTYPHMG